MCLVLRLTILFLLIATEGAVYGQVASRPLIATQPHWYTQFQLGSQDFEVVIPASRPFQFGVAPSQLKVGHFITPRWAVETGYTFTYFLDVRTTYGTTPDSLPSSTSFYSKSRSHLISFLLRRRLTRNLNHRVRFDATTALAILTYWDEFKNRHIENGQEMWYNEYSSQTVNAYLMMGAAMSYRLSRHLDLELNGTLSRNLQSINQNYSRRALNSTFGFQRGWSLGIRYNFLLRKPSPVAE